MWQRVLHGVTACALAGAALPPTSATAQNPLGTAQNFGVLGASTVTNTGLTLIKGDLGVSPGTAITGLGSVVLIGTVHQNDAAAMQAHTDAAAAYAAFVATPFTTDLSGQNLGGLTLTPGVYFFDTSAQLTGNLTLDFGGLANARFLFQIGTTLTTATAASVTVQNGGAGAGLYWNVGSAATFGTGTDFWGNVLATQSITMNTGARIVCGRALALNAAVTLDQNAVTNDCINGADFGSFGLSGGRQSVVPEPSTFAMLLVGGALVLPALRRQRRRRA